MEDEKLDQSELSRRVFLLEEEIAKIKKRNEEVEANKAWETSLFRVSVIVGVTYCITSLVFWAIRVPHPLLNALIPTVGYYLSTQTLPFLKRWWISRR